MLRKFNRIITVSKAAILDMNYTPDAKFVLLDNPGVPKDEIILLKKIKKASNKNRENKYKYILYSGGYDVIKGILDALLAFSIVKKKYSGKVKLVVTGRENEMTAIIKRFAKRLNIGNDVIFTGMISKKEYYRIKSRASLTIHPSHLDAFSYNVFESLMLETPVVGYSISAMKIYYKGLSGVTLVQELDLEALGNEVLNILENPPEVVESPKILNWDSIINKEINTLKTLVSANEEAD